MWYKKANKTVWIVENGQGSQKTLIEITKLISTGQLTESSLVWQSGMENWQEISTVPELYRLFRQTVWIVENGQASEKTRKEIKELISTGKLKWTSLVWQEGLANWTEIRNVPDLLMLFYQNEAPGIAPQQTAPTNKKTVVESDFAKNFQVGDRVVYGYFDIPDPKNWKALEKFLYSDKQIIKEMFTVDMIDSYRYKGKVLRWNSYKEQTTKIDEIEERNRTQYVILPKLDDFVKPGTKIWYYFGAGITYPCFIRKVDGTLDLLEESTGRGLPNADINSCLFERSDY